jgi:DNA modification methylase
MQPIYSTFRGTLYHGDSLDIRDNDFYEDYKGKINLIFTSPPFPLIRKKAYGNLSGRYYIEWLTKFAPIWRELLTPNGSLIIEIGNAWERRSPTMSLLPIESLIELKKEGNFYLCQEFIWNNTSKLPTPAQWVNIERIRVKDAFTRFWWLSPSQRPKANNKNILNKYSQSMKTLLKNKKYSSGKRPSQHRIGVDSFLNSSNNGSIPSNVISLPNTLSNDDYLSYCRKNGVKCHPARMPIKLAEFFIKFLTDEDDIIFDPFAGSNVTGFVAEKNNRNWLSIEKDLIYATSSKSRFDFCLSPVVEKGEEKNG